MAFTVEKGSEKGSQKGFLERGVSEPSLAECEPSGMCPSNHVVSVCTAAIQRRIVRSI